MKKLLLVALMGLVGLGIATDAFGRYHRNCGGYSRCGGCPEVEECPPPPCCEREQCITVREPPRKVCGWVCPDGTHEIPTSQADLVD